MPDKSKYDLAYRPANYWTDMIAPVNVKGQWRRELIREAIEAGALDQVPEETLADSLSPADREFVAHIHPSMMGGEFLPDHMADEVEIARVCFNSVTADVISIRARRVGQRIAYRVIDEYEEVYVILPKTGKQPLTLGQLINLIDKARREPDGWTGLVTFHYNRYRDDGDLALLPGFIWVESDFYPELGQWYSELEAEYLEHRES